MFNIYSIKGNEIFINAPGNANQNKLKNDLIWDINNFLTAQFDLYMLFDCKKPYDADFYIPVSGFMKKYLALKKLDDMFIQRTVLSDDEVNYYRKTADPLRKINDDVFRELFTVENIDMDYIAVENIEQLSGINITGGSVKSLYRRITETEKFLQPTREKY